MKLQSKSLLGPLNRRRLDRTLWINPITQVYNTMIGRKIVNEIVQEYRDVDGTLNQWIFTEITPTSFHWIGRSSKDVGKGWDVGAEFFGRRREMIHES